VCVCVCVCVSYQSQSVGWDHVPYPKCKSGNLEILP